MRERAMSRMMDSISNMFTLTTLSFSKHYMFLLTVKESEFPVAKTKHYLDYFCS